MAIQIDPHALERAEERGTNESEIIDVIQTGFSVPARHGRSRRAKVFDFDRSRNNRHYPQKRVEVIYTIEEDEIITVTVYVFYGRWEHDDAGSV